MRTIGREHSKTRETKLRFIMFFSINHKQCFYKEF
jgi:hypothetical protein